MNATVEEVLKQKNRNIYLETEDEYFFGVSIDLLDDLPKEVLKLPVIEMYNSRIGSQNQWEIYTFKRGG